MLRKSRAAATATVVEPELPKETREEAFERLTLAPVAALRKACHRLRTLARTREGGYDEAAVEALFEPLQRELNAVRKGYLYRLGALDE